MTLEEYRDHVAQIINTVGLHHKMFSDLEGLINESEFLNVFEFYKETLELNCDYGITPAFLFFANSDTINAKAVRSPNNEYLLGINRGTINWLIDNFKSNQTLVSDNNISLFDNLAPHLDIPINNLMYQAGCHFTFYHEMAHLIQKSDYLELSMEENPQQVDVFDFNRHLLEIDADTYSALCLGTHIMQYSGKIFGENSSKVLVEALIILFSIPIILYLLSFEGNSVELYYRESTHPHPAIRLTNFLMVLTHYCNGVLDGKDSGFTVNQGDMFISAMSIAEKLQEHFFNGKIVSRYREGITANRPQVMEYVSLLVETNNLLTTTATHKWNLRNV